MSQMSVDQALQMAIRHHQAGQLREAEEGYRRILAQTPNHPEPLHLLGVLAGQAGQVDVGIDLIERAIALRSMEPAYHNNLGNLYIRKGRTEDALAAYRRALELKPAYASAHNNMGNALKQTGQLTQAIAAYKQALQLQPDYADAHNNLGSALNQQHEFTSALSSLRRAIELDPQLAEAHSNLGTTLKELGEIEEAIASFRRAVALQPHHCDLINNLAIMLAAHGQMEGAIVCFRQVLQLKPSAVSAYINLGTALSAEGRYSEAITCYGRAFEIKAHEPKLHYHLGITLGLAERLDDAVAAFQQAIGLDPDYAEAHENLGNILRTAGQVDEAIACYRQAMRSSREFGSAHSNLLQTLTYHPDCDAHALYREHQRWNQERGESLKKFIRPHTNDRTPDRRLRVGYLSPDFRDHALGRYILPVLREHDRAQVEIFCYSNVRFPDAVTDQFRRYAHFWRPIRALSDQAVADLIRRDAIDILVDLNLHLAYNRLAIFARKPAPVQFTFAGYPGTTGLATIDYRLTDPYLDPPSSDVSMYSEESLRLPHTFWCYDPLGIQVDVNAIPAQSAGFVTFGCLNNLCKVNDHVLRLWAQALKSIPGSRFHLLALPGGHRQRITDAFARAGIAPDRITFVSPRPRVDYLALYHQIDISLDTFPYNGHTTSLDSLWMGVPVVTLVGKTVVGRAGLSQLTNLGLPELIARTWEEYVEISSTLATDLPRLAHLRATLRHRMERSVLMDAPNFARGVEGAYRQAWRRWCLTLHSRGP